MSERAVVEAGHLYVVATPIGNLGDLSSRALKVLAGVDRVAAEDTRTSAQLLAQFGLRARMTALHEHNESEVAADLLAALRAGESVALIADAGTPLISDPGYALVAAARAACLPVIAVPGPCAAVAALSISGLPTDSFLFVGFLPAKPVARRARMALLANEPRTLVLYESSHRIGETLGTIVEELGPDRRLCIARELTKLFEESATLTAAAAVEWLAADENRTRGEFVLVVEGAGGAEPDLAAGTRVFNLLLKELPPSKAARLAADITGVNRKALYAMAVKEE